jgi:uncharacterized repeat protein (TIGR01451 family)
VNNAGNTPLQLTSLQDDKLGNLLPDFIAANSGSSTVQAGQTVTFTKNYTITGSDPSPIVNTVTMIAQDPFGSTLTKTDSESVTIIPPPPVSISGGAWNDLNCDGVLDPGEPPLAGATFTLTDLSGLPVNDIFGVPVAPQVGATFNFINLNYGSYLVTETDPIGFVSSNAIPGTGGTKITVNQIRVDATTPGNSYPNQNFLDCQPAPAIDITKTANPLNAYDGTTITYTFVVNNTGNTPLTVSVNDTVLGNITPNFVAAHGTATFAAGQTVSFTVQHTILPADPDPLANTVTVNATDPFGTPVSDNDSASVGILRPCIDVTKAAVPDQGREGTLITYNFSVINCGNRALTGVTVTDTLMGDLTTDFVAANGGSSTLALAATVNS